MIDVAEVTELLGRWWFNYDQGHFDVMASLLTDDVHFSCRTSSGTTAFEEFVRSDNRGRDEVMAWQTGAVCNLSTAIVNGAARREEGALRLSEVEVVLDTDDSVVFRTRS